jgi:hypothetical protein
LGMKDSSMRSQISLRKHIALRLTTPLRWFWENMRPVVSWIYVFVACYVILGAIIYPSWWKRFFFGGGFFDQHLWKFAANYFWLLVVNGDPLGISLVGLLACCIFLAIYSMGKHGLKNLLKTIRPVSTAWLVFVSAMLVLMIISVSFVKHEFRTIDELEQETQRLMMELESRDPFYISFRIVGPKTGFYLYLDPVKVSQSYNSLQDELVAASETITKAAEGSGKIGLDAGALDLEATKKASEKRSVHRVAPKASPERQAKWLITKFVKEKLAVTLFETDETGTWELKAARKTLDERGVKLTSAQESDLVEADAKIFAEKFLRSKTNVPLLMDGNLLIYPNNNTLEIVFRTRGPVPVTCTGALEPKFLDKAVLTCVNNSKEGCKLYGHVLGIIWNKTISPKLIELKIIILAIW